MISVTVDRSCDACGGAQPDPDEYEWRRVVEHLLQRAIR